MFVPTQFKPGWWSKNRHVQTIWGAVFRRPPELPDMKRVRLELEDGDFIDVDMHLKSNQLNPSKMTTTLLLHGLEGSAESSYIKGLTARLAKTGKQVVVMHFRGCSGETNRLLKSYHSGVSCDLQQVIVNLKQRDITVDYIVGFSLGGNVLLKWLGENHPENQVKAAVAVSVPLLLNECATAIDVGFSRVYANRLLKTLKLKTFDKKKQFSDQLSLEESEIDHLNSFWDFDEKVTAPIHGFKDAKDYYQKVSSRQFLRHIKIPTLIIHAKDDPFMNQKVIPEPSELSANIQFELSDFGGHVGFVEGNWPWTARYYLEQRIPEFLDQAS